GSASSSGPEGGIPAAGPPSPPPDPSPTPGVAGPAAPGAAASGERAAAEDGRSPEEMSVGELVFEISDRASVLVREEIELAKTEVTEKVNKLLRGGVAGGAAAVFLIAALILLMHGVAWLLNDLVFDNFWAGFFVEALLFLLIAAGAGFFAYRAFQSASPPTPDMAIEEAKEIKAAFDTEEGT
ncbi:MAG TPA: phage holin family protein, partial [Solirubrobacterales bacterium]|nr:phage holin family protein [Solirubrobacterales bacterium]